MQKVRPALLKGFDQEYLPQEQLKFNHLIDVIRKNFELFGFLPIETPSAELREVLTSKGGVEKEIYALTRLAQSEEDEPSSRGALRFDLTVPLARYVAMRERELAFPFRRYQIQRVWRGENPQARKGRFREFYQCDIDIINRDSLSYLAEAEIPSVIYRVFKEMRIGDFRIRINNRKVLKGLLQYFGVPNESAAVVLRALDKVEKEDPSRIHHDLVAVGMSSKTARHLHELIATKRGTSDTLHELAHLEPPTSSALTEGIELLRKVAGAISEFGVPETAVHIDLSVVRGLDYYTGTIYETTLTDYPELGSICSGGRYDDLASYFTDTKLPGVGISIGLTRLFSRLKETKLLDLAESPIQVLIITMDSKYLHHYLSMARDLRQEGVNTEVYLESAKLDKQLSYANRKGFRIAVIGGESEFAANQVQVKNLFTREQQLCSIGDVTLVVKKMLKHASHVGDA
jgi:histidyl-tRNA synthetase